MILNLDKFTQIPNQNTLSNNITYTNSKCIAHFITFKNQDLQIDSVNPNGVDVADSSSAQTTTINNKSLDTTDFIEDDAIISCTIARDKNSPSGYFSFILKPIKNYVNIVKPGDWVLVYLDDASNINLSTQSGLKCIGIVNRVAENKVAMENGTVVTSYVVHGSDFGKVFEKTEMFFNPYISPDLKATVLQKLAINIFGSPQNFINAYLDIFLGDAKKQNLEDILFQQLIPSKLYTILNGERRSKGSNVAFDDILVRQFADETKEGNSVYRSISRLMSGSLWNTIEQASNRELNEIYTDLIDNKPTLVFKKKPLSQELLINRISETINNKSFEISEAFIINSNLGSADHILFNYVSLFPDELLAKDQTVFAVAGTNSKEVPQVSKQSIEKFGLRSTQLVTEYLFSLGAYVVDQDLFIKWMRELGHYWINFHRFETGSIDVIGKTDFNIGAFYKIPERNKVYMVESIQWDWSYRQPIAVSLGLTHGVFIDGSFTDSNKSDKFTLGSNVYSRTNGQSGVARFINGIKTT